MSSCAKPILVAHMWPDMESRQQGCATYSRGGTDARQVQQYAPAISPLTVAAPAGEGRTATSREVAVRKRYLRLSCGWLVAVAVLAISPIAHADPVHMACSGQMMLSNNKVQDTNAVLSLAVDLRAGTVTVGGYAPLGIYPAFPLSPSKEIQETNEVNFVGTKAEGGVIGSVDRVTGEAHIFFKAQTPQEQFFNGICRPAQKLF
jgi:hypothetical protein